MATVLDKTEHTRDAAQVTLEQLRLQHPQDSEYTLLRRLVASGARVAPEVRAELMRQQREAILAATGMAKGVYEDDYLTHVRGRWAS